jgi:competence protein ComEC
VSGGVALRAPHLAVGAFCAGLALSLVARPAGPATAAAAATLAVAALVLPARARAFALAGLLLLAGCLWGGLRLADLDRSLLASRVGETAHARLEVTGPARRGAFSVRVPVRVRRFHDDPLDERARLDLPRARSPPQGAVVEAVVRVTSPRGPDDGFDESAYLNRQGVHVVLRADSYRVVGRRGGLGGLADRLRRHLAGTIAPGLEGERRAVVAGVVLGEDEGLDSELQERFRASGLYHLLAVSGQNIAYVVAGVLLAAWVVGIPRWSAHLVSVAAVLGYVAAVGWQPSVVRAGVAGVLASLAWLASRPSDRWYFFLLGACVLLAWNPRSALEPGFQLSFAAVAAIFVAVPRLERVLDGYPLPRRLAAIVAVAAACGGVTAPILWLHFGAVPVYSVLANALAEPVVAPLLGGALAASAVHPVLPQVAAALAWANGWLAAYLAWCARAVGGLPHAQVSSWTALLGLAALGSAALGLARARRRRRPLAVALATLTVAVLVAWQARPGTEQLPPPTGLRITFLDVGQGDSVLVESPAGAVLVDQGPPEADVAGQLAELGVSKLDAIVLTHPQRDHIGGAAQVLEEIDVASVLDPAIPSESTDEREALAAARSRGARLVVARRGQDYRLGRLQLRVLWPDGPGPPGDDPNRHAVVLLVSYGAVDALLTADAETDVTLGLALSPVEILKVAHHGSADAGLARLLARTRPRLAVISVGRDNGYGHPTPETIAVLRAAPGLMLFRTDLDGRVRVESDGARLSVAAER